MVRFVFCPIAMIDIATHTLRLRPRENKVHDVINDACLVMRAENDRSRTRPVPRQTDYFHDTSSYRRRRAIGSWRVHNLRK
jgi:hypothetical protein